MKDHNGEEVNIIKWINRHPLSIIIIIIAGILLFRFPRFISNFWAKY